ncbi:uncharacterized protein LOC120687960 isoform X5 [Panicum virgatum]|uniref:uncharacterized protein LOC120687960 isoform X5 n=1 Tax=Panicum virgatum TaxID=38727 RepID=UPI0019D6541C|nr:uncharacterized protein LOC120687960 isoform X5 [Panicum virgatum]
MKTVRYFGRAYEWVGLSRQPNIISKFKRTLGQFTPARWDKDEWYPHLGPWRFIQERNGSAGAANLRAYDGAPSVVLVIVTEVQGTERWPAWLSTNDWEAIDRYTLTTSCPLTRSTSIKQTTRPPCCCSYTLGSG